ncbi:unnamed protein product [Owenia fusiformis]|uniref:Uncharacterized protein n=1 Tax=Owenia fusiformis TaxID=6347 RepID=A0A8J1UXU4_OWEFU|nr:unnamed protein product [Owenia fusiformis]
MNETLVARSAAVRKQRFKLPVNHTLTNELFQWGTVSSFIHVMHNGIISYYGVVFVGGLMVIPNSCLDRPKRVKQARNYFEQNIKDNLNKLPRHGEVFVITQFYSIGFYHAMVESLPRLSRYIRFIDQRKDIKIYINCQSFMKSSLETLFPSRNISELVICETNGPIIATRVYFPEGSPCFKSTQSGLSQLSKEFRRYITPGIPVPPKNYIILIKRSRKRSFAQHNEIASFLADIAKQNDMEFLVFSDARLPSFNDTKKIFNQARLVVAPHGAGVANTLFSNPGLFVIEIVCNSPRMNLCFRELTIFLGHHYHGIYSKSGCPFKLNVDVNEVKEAVRFYIKHVVA